MARGRRRAKGSITPKRMIEAIKDSGGNKTVIAERLKCTRSIIDWRIKNQPGRRWDEVREAYQNEIESVGDLAEGTIRAMIKQRLDSGTALRASTWALLQQFRNRGYADKSTVRIEGELPLLIQSERLKIEELDLPLAVKKQILKAIEEKKKPKNENK